MKCTGQASWDTEGTCRGLEAVLRTLSVVGSVRAGAQGAFTVLLGIPASHGQTLGSVLKCLLIISYKHQPGQLVEVKI